MSEPKPFCARCEIFVRTKAIWRPAGWSIAPDANDCGGSSASRPMTRPSLSSASSPVSTAMTYAAWPLPAEAGAAAGDAARDGGVDATGPWQALANPSAR